MCQIYSNELDPDEGSQLPVLYSAREHGFFRYRAILPPSSSRRSAWAMASAMKRDTRIAVGWIRRAARRRIGFSRRPGFRLDLQGAGRAHIVNNQWAISTFQGIARGGSGTFAAPRPGLRPAGAARRRQRLSRRPCRGEVGDRAGAAQPGSDPGRVRDYRVGAHSTSDDPSAYRPKTESDAWPLGESRASPEGASDPSRHLVGGTAQAGRSGDLAEVIAIQKEARATARCIGPHPLGRDMFEGVYEQMPPHLRRQRQQAGSRCAGSAPRRGAFSWLPQSMSATEWARSQQ